MGGLALPDPSVSSRRVKVDRLPADGALVLEPAAHHHLVRVLRLQTGASVLAFDGQGNEQICQLHRSPDGEATLQGMGPIDRAAPAKPAHLALALLKPKALDIALRMAVEAGITHLHIFDAARSQRRPARPDRWRRILAAAATQSGRADLPPLLVHASLDAVLTALPRPLFIGVPGASPSPAPDGVAAILVGPEGGFATAEVDQAVAAGAQPIGLGRWVLRAETAAILASGFITPS